MVEHHDTAERIHISLFSAVTRDMYVTIRYTRNTLYFTDGPCLVSVNTVDLASIQQCLKVHRAEDDKDYYGQGGEVSSSRGTVPPVHTVIKNSEDKS